MRRDKEFPKSPGNRRPQPQEGSRGAAPIASFALLLTVSCGWVSPRRDAGDRGSRGQGSIDPGVQQPTQGCNPLQVGAARPGAADPAGAGASVTKGQDTQRAGKRYLNRGDNNMGFVTMYVRI